jgi:hypothetical protein
MFLAMSGFCINKGIKVGFARIHPIDLFDVFDSTASPISLQELTDTEMSQDFLQLIFRRLKYIPKNQKHPQRITQKYSEILYASKMFDGKPCRVRLRCENRLMNYVIDRFGEDVQTSIVSKERFDAGVDVSVSQTFFALGVPVCRASELSVQRQ